MQMAEIPIPPQQRYEQPVTGLRGLFHTQPVLSMFVQVANNPSYSTDNPIRYPVEPRESQHARLAHES